MGWYFVHYIYIGKLILLLYPKKKKKNHHLNWAFLSCKGAGKHNIPNWFLSLLEVEHNWDRFSSFFLISIKKNSYLAQKKRFGNMEKGVQRWVVDISKWDPSPHDFYSALSLLPQHQRSSVTRFCFSFLSFTLCLLAGKTKTTYLSNSYTASNIAPFS